MIGRKRSYKIMLPIRVTATFWYSRIVCPSNGSHRPSNVAHRCHYGNKESGRHRRPASKHARSRVDSSISTSNTSSVHLTILLLFIQCYYCSHYYNAFRPGHSTILVVIFACYGIRWRKHARTRRWWHSLLSRDANGLGTPNWIRP